MSETGGSCAASGRPGDGRSRGGAGPSGEDGPATMLYLSGEDVRALHVPMGDVVDAVEEAFRLKGAGAVAMPPKVTIQGAGGSFAQVMPAWIGAAQTGPATNAEEAGPANDAAGSFAGTVERALGLKLVTVVPENQARGLPVTNALVVLDDPVTGLPAAVLEGGLITALRTGASVGVAARHLALADVGVIGVLGCGVQARAAVRALACVLPALTLVRCHDARPAAAAAFAAELPHLVAGDRRSASAGSVTMSACRPEVIVCDRPQDVCAGAGVVVTAITMSAAEPPLGPGLLEQGALAVALDYDAAWSAAAMAACDRFVTDDAAQTLAARQHGPRLGAIPAVDADLGEIAAGLAAGRRRAEQRIFCLNLGLAVEDVVCAGLVLERAAAVGAGRRLPL